MSCKNEGLEWEGAIKANRRNQAGIRTNKAILGSNSGFFDGYIASKVNVVGTGESQGAEHKRSDCHSGPISWTLQLS